MKKNRFQLWAWRWKGADWPVLSTIAMGRERAKCLIIAEAMSEADRTIERCWRRLRGKGRLEPVNFPKD